MQRSLTRAIVIDLNVLPPELRPQRYSGWFVVGLVAVLIGCVLLVPMVSIEHSASQKTDRLQQQLNLVTNQLNGVEMDIGQGRGLHAQIDKAKADVATLKSERLAILGVGQPLAPDVSFVFTAAPPDTRITGVSHSEGKITVTGEAPAAGSVIAYARALEQKPFPQVTITALTMGAFGVGPMTFTVEIQR